MVEHFLSMYKALGCRTIKVRERKKNQVIVYISFLAHYVTLSINLVTIGKRIKIRVREK